MHVPVNPYTRHSSFSSVCSDLVSDFFESFDQDRVGLLWDLFTSDDRDMQRRNPKRRAQRYGLDPDQADSAMRLLRKYCRRRYGDVLVPSQDFSIPQRDNAGTPDFTQSAYQYPRQPTAGERLSHLFNSSPLGPVSSELHFPATSPVFPQTSFLSEIRFKEKESFATNFIRITKFLYSYLGLNYIILATLISGYACLGGWVFMTLEEENQTLSLQMEKNMLEEDSRQMAKNLMVFIKEKNCSTSNDIQCIELIKKAFVERSEKVAFSIRGEAWQWDFWNSVFFAATIFTTIGYGNLACKTDIGRIVTIIYGLIGIPLMLFVLKVYGELAIKGVQYIRYFFKRKLGRWAYHFKKSTLKRTPTIELVDSDDVPGLDGSADTSEEEELFTTFPLKWALIIVFFFMVVCSFIVSFWEKWDFLTAFYFFFVSLSTIGFGDVIPEHPRTACGLFVLYFLGLALFSMVYAILQERVENQYMWALELIDQEYQESQKNDLICEIDEQPPLPNERGGPTNMNSQNSVRWRQRPTGHSMETTPDRPSSEHRFSVYSPGEGMTNAPPVLGAFMFHNLSMKKKLIARSESILNKAGPKRPSTLFPSNEVLSTQANSSGGSPWLMSGDLNNPRDPTALGKSAGLSAPNLAGGNRSPSGALSVITEASDEDARHFKKNFSKKHLGRTEEADENSSEGSNESLDQPLEELQLEAQEHSITPKPYREPTASFLKVRKTNEHASSSERKPLSPKHPLEEEINNDSEASND